ncbi:hypothetical protein V8U11_05855 [Pseudomonas chlororaphis]|uniref:hypothetical protein n=1 Tax=Pseudomonas chlororaphis TaxID=587753 RepID=UPI0030CAE1BE
MSWLGSITFASQPRSVDIKVRSADVKKLKKNLSNVIQCDNKLQKAEKNRDNSIAYSIRVRDLKEKLVQANAESLKMIVDNIKIINESNYKHSPKKIIELTSMKQELDKLAPKVKKLEQEIQETARKNTENEQKAEKEWRARIEAQQKPSNSPVPVMSKEDHKMQRRQDYANYGSAR